MTALDDLYPIFCIPTLRHLALEPASRFIDSNTERDVRRVRTSPITFLRMPFRYDDLRHMTEVLTWPITLEKFHIYAHGHHYTKLTAQGLLRDLHFHKDSLSEFFIDGDWNSGGRFPVGRQLLEFSNLRPRQTDDAVELFDWLHGIIKNKKQNYPNLWRFALWQFHHGRRSCISTYDRATISRQADYITAELESVNLLKAFSDAGIEFSCNTDIQPALFDAIGN
jgi:hypothetical protein